VRRHDSISSGGDCSDRLVGVQAGCQPERAGGSATDPAGRQGRLAGSLTGRGLVAVTNCNQKSPPAMVKEIQKGQVKLVRRQGLEPRTRGLRGRNPLSASVHSSALAQVSVSGERRCTPADEHELQPELQPQRIHIWLPEPLAGHRRGAAGSPAPFRSAARSRGDASSCVHCSHLPRASASGMAFHPDGCGPVASSASAGAGAAARGGFVRPRHRALVVVRSRL